jgi:outer membrane protein assembly factor BamB
MKRKFITIMFLFVGIFLFPKSSLADSPDPYTKQDGLNSGIVSGVFNPDVVKNWSVPVYPSAPPVVTNNRIYYLDFQPGRSEVYLKSRSIYSDSMTWSYQLANGATSCPPVYAENNIYSCENDLVALDKNSGRIFRRYNSNSKKFTRVVSVDNKILGFTDSNQIVAFDKATGLVVWTRQINKNPFGAVIVAEGKIAFNAAPYDGEAFAINSLDGTVAWHLDIPGAVGDLVYSSTTKRLYDSSRKWSLDIATGAMGPADIGMGWPFIVNNQLISYWQNGADIDFFVKDASTGGWISLKNGVVKNESISSNPVMVDGKIYILTYQNRLLQFDLSGNCLNPTTPKLGSGYDGFQGKIIIDNGRLFTYDTWHQEIGYYDLKKVVTTTTSTIHLTSPYIDYGFGRHYLGQLHAHVEPETELTNLGLFKNPPTVADVETRYRNAGYNFIALTEHNKIIPNPAVPGIMHLENSEEITQGPGGDHILAVGISSVIQPTGSDQERIDQVVGQGGVPVLAHPDSSQYPFSISSLIKLQAPTLAFEVEHD